MALGYNAPATDPYEALARQLQSMANRLRELERPDRTQLVGLVAKVRAAMQDLSAQVQIEIAANSYTRQQIEQRIADPPAITPHGVDSAGDVRTRGDLRVDGALRAPQVTTTILTSQYFATYAPTVAGKLGHVPSSRRFKQYIQPATAPLDAILALRLTTFRYFAAVEVRGEQADVEWGLIAEEVHALGLHWLVSYDEEGLPVGVRFERLALALLPVIQNHDSRLKALEASLLRVNLNGTR